MVPSVTAGIRDREQVGAEHWVVGAIATALATAILTPVAARLNAWAAVLVVVACQAALPWAAHRLPARLAGAWRRHPALSLAWLLLALFALVQMARLSAFMVDSSRLWGSAVPDPAASNHQCLSAYVHAADLSRRGEPNVYDARWYPAFTTPPYAEPRGVESPVDGLGRWVHDPYEYPPPFLLLPRAALALTNSFDHIRTAWFVLQTTIFVTAALLLACWIGGAPGLLAGLLVPAVLASVPTMLNLQFGQFHATTIVLAVAGMIAFEKRRPALGGGLLAVAILAKIFPGLLLITLAARRCWRAMAWTLAFVVVFAVVAVMVLGADPFVAFVRYQLPRIATGEAFSFIDRPDVPVFIVSRNFSVPGVVHKLRLLGVTGLPSSAAWWLALIYTLLLVGLAWRAGRRAATPVANVLIWLALLNLAALRSPVAPSAYVTAPVLWMLVLLAGEVRGRYSVGGAIVIAWVLIAGPPPLPDRIDLLVALLGQMLAVALGVWLLLRSPARSDPAPQH